MDIDDSEWVTQAQAGDREAFNRLLRLHAGRVLSQARKLGASLGYDAADDLAQEAFVAAWGSLARFDGCCKFSTWLYAILRHRVYKALRQKQFSAAPELIEQLADSADPREGMHNEDRKRVLRAAIAELSDSHRAVLEMRYFGDLPLAEIAKSEGISLGTVKSRLHYALDKLKRALQANEGTQLIR
ncbi:MAG: RNA polymerase sigma-70 factor (ECF subfamily) [Rhodothermales bacterium]|jgi:RNA polymerase sigma-70 factor (ECF subfamily)